MAPGIDFKPGSTGATKKMAFETFAPLPPAVLVHSAAGGVGL